MQYLQPGIYRVDSPYAAEQYYNFNHENAAGFVAAAFLNYLPDAPDENEIIEYFADNADNAVPVSIQYQHALLPNDPNLEFVKILLMNPDHYNFDNLMFEVDPNQRKRYKGLFSRFDRNGPRRTIVVQFDSSDFLAGFVAFYRDFVGTDKVFKHTLLLFDGDEPVEFDVTLPLIGLNLK